MYIDDVAAEEWPGLETTHWLCAQVKITFTDSTQAPQFLNQVVIYRLTKSQREFATVQGVPQYSSLKKLKDCIIATWLYILIKMTEKLEQYFTSIVLISYT